MKDRIPGYPGRYSAVVPSADLTKLQSGKPFSITLTRDDAPVEEGTPYSKAAVLPDEVAAAICPGVEDPTPADALLALQKGKAPSGFGLGTKAKWVDNFDQATASGFYATMGGTPDGGMWVGITIANDTNLGVQIAWKTYSGTSQKVMMRRFESGTFGAWQEWSPSAFAPSGYGLGGSGVGVNDLNSFVRCGWSAFSSGCANAPFDYGMAMSINRYGTQYTQIAFDPYMNNSGSIAVRHFDGSNWKDWEYINPPMQFGKEYKTTERFFGKPVYTKLIDIDSYGDEIMETLYDTGEVCVLPLVYYVDRLVDAKFTAWEGLFPVGNNFTFYYNEDSLMLDVVVEEGTFYLNAYAFDSTLYQNATLLLKYTKTTD